MPGPIEHVRLVGLSVSVTMIARTLIFILAALILEDRSRIWDHCFQPSVKKTTTGARGDRSSV